MSGRRKRRTERQAGRQAEGEKDVNRKIRHCERERGGGGGR